MGRGHRSSRVSRACVGCEGAVLLVKTGTERWAIRQKDVRICGGLVVLGHDDLLIEGERGSAVVELVGQLVRKRCTIDCWRAKADDSA
jgi:hypothetical protein